MATAMPAARNGRAMSSARGYWFDCTPTSATRPKLPCAPEPGDQRRHVDARVGLVDRLDVDVDIGPEHLPLGAVGGDAVDRGQRIGGDHRAPPADHVAVVVVMGRLDQDQLKAPASRPWAISRRSSALRRRAIEQGALRRAAMIAVGAPSACRPMATPIIAKTPPWDRIVPVGRLTHWGRPITAKLTARTAFHRNPRMGPRRIPSRRRVAAF